MARRVGKKIDFKQWVAIPSIALDINTVTTTLGASIAFAVPLTILRIRGEVVINMDGAADNASNQVTVGLGIISSDAFAAGAGSVPEPATESEYPWMYWYSTPLRVADFSAIATEASQIAAASRLVVDSKAMRKVKPGESLVWVIETSAAIAINVTVGVTRVLVGT